MDMLRRLKRSRGFTLIEIAIVVAIIGILILVALPLFSGARTRAYVAEARQITSEWKSLAWACLIQRSNNETFCDSSLEVSFTGPTSNSDAWQWTALIFACGDTASVLATVAAGTCGSNFTGANSFVALRVPRVAGVTGLDNDYVLVIRSNTGKVQESPADGVAVGTP